MNPDVYTHPRMDPRLRKSDTSRSAVRFGISIPGLIFGVPGEGARRMLCGTMNTQSGPGRPWSFQGSGRKRKPMCSGRASGSRAFRRVRSCAGFLPGPFSNAPGSGFGVLPPPGRAKQPGCLRPVCSAGLIADDRTITRGSSVGSVSDPGLQCFESLLQKLAPHGAQRFRLNGRSGMDTHLQFQTDLMYGVHDRS